MRQEKEKMLRHFESVPYLISIYILLMMAMFAQKVCVYTYADNMEYHEKVIAWLVIAIFYIYYFNSIINFARGFYSIM